ncbi:MAG: type II toxin-antitoxin system RelE/ParE family toxin [Verrucomicrobia bacterium]|nr:type II toxin-antitoxin system RelE/ParE family toxin [Verrucomicrobiota bacterium]
MIRSFACRKTALFFEERKTRSLPSDIQRVALRKLAQLHAVTELNHLSIPPGNRLETLKGNRVGKHSIRINDQWRIRFRWKTDGPHEVEIIDYH